MANSFIDTREGLKSLTPFVLGIFVFNLVGLIAGILIGKNFGDEEK